MVVTYEEYADWVKGRLMTREEREQEVEDMADRVRVMAGNYAHDVAQERGIDSEDALRLAWTGIRRAAKEGPERKRKD